MQSKLTLINAFLALTSIALAAMATLIWVQPKHPSRVDPGTIHPEPRTVESIKVDRPYLSRDDVNPIAAGNLFRKEREEYKPPPPPQVAQVPVAPPRPSVPSLPPPNVSLKGVFIANGTRLAFLEGKYSYRSGNQVQEKDVRRKGYYLGERLGDFKINQIERTRVSLVNTQGSSMTLQLAKHIPDEMINRKGTHFYHKSKNGRTGSKVEVEKIMQVPPPPKIVSPMANNRSQPNVVTPGQASSRQPRTTTAPVVKLPQNIITPPRPQIKPPRISGAVTIPRGPASTPHISGMK